MQCNVYFAHFGDIYLYDFSGIKPKLFFLKELSKYKLIFFSILLYDKNIRKLVIELLMLIQEYLRTNLCKTFC